MTAGETALLFMNFDPQDPQEGIYPNIPEPIYRTANGISQTEIKEMELSPAHYLAYVTGPKNPPTWDQTVGTLTHALTLQKKELFVVIPSDAPKMPSKTQLNAKKPSQDTIDAIAWWNQFRMTNPGKEYLDKEDADKIRNIAHSVWTHPDAAEILGRASGFEVAAFKRHEETGLMMKGLADCIAMDDKDMMTIPDLKTCQPGGASEAGFRKFLADWGGYRQAAYYLDLFGASFFPFIAVEKEPPYAVAVWNLGRRSIELGRLMNERDLKTIARCIEENHWPAYPPGIHTIDVPEWVFNKELA